jgi:uncharacterized Zn finger protein
MAAFSRTWWGKRFIEALEEITDSARLGRGRSYARNGKVKDYQIANGRITAQVRGSVNPYFGVYKEPLYEIRIEVKAIAPTDWSKIISLLGSKASLISKLLLGEVPDNIESALSELNLHLLPSTRKDLQTTCSCPDWENPCKHIAGVYYLIAAELDKDPFLLFELRGISRDKLQQELAKSPLGKALSSSLETQELPLEPVTSYYTQPLTVPLPDVSTVREFWLTQKRLPQIEDSAMSSNIPGLLVKKAGDFPPFWSKDTSFLEVMEELYQRIRSKSDI